MKYIIIILIIAMVLLTGCVQDIGKIKNDNYLDETVTVRGEVKNTVKFGDLSGYTLVESDGDSISVSSEDLPAEGKKVIVKGTLKKTFLIGYYIED